MKKKEVGPIMIKPIIVKKLQVAILGITPLVINKPGRESFLPVRSKGILTDRQKLPHYVDLEGRCYFPASGFKRAIVNAGNAEKKFPLSLLNVCISVQSQNSEGGVILYGDAPKGRSDVVRIGGKVYDNWKSEFPRWGAILDIEYDENSVSEKNILDLVQESGKYGIGDMRPSRYGLEFGQYKVISMNEFKKEFKLR